MDDRKLLEEIYVHLDKSTLLKKNPNLSFKDLKKFFKRIADAMGVAETPEQPEGTFSELVMYTDGAARGNPGPAAIAAVVKSKGGEVLVEYSRVIGTATNNIAEYQALVSGLDKALEYQPEKLNIYSDSELLVKQMTGVYKAKDSKLRELKDIALVKLQNINEYTITHIKRELNSEADALANKALDENKPGEN